MLTLGSTFTDMAGRLQERQVELARVQHQLTKSEAHHRLLAEASNDMITRLSIDFRRVYVSPAAIDLLGYEPAELLGRHPSETVHPDDWAQLNADLNLPLLGMENVARGFYRGIRKDGSHMWLETSGRRLADGSGFVFVTRDISERKALEEQLESANRQLRVLVRQDALTGLANRRRFDEVLGEEFRRADRHGHELALFMIDVDHFKAFNDCYGHPAGDACLRAVATVFKEALRRPSDVAARYGGEEFAVVMSETDAAQAEAAAGRLRAGVQALAVCHSGSPIGVVTISVGVSMLSMTGAQGGPAALVEAADSALYAAKTSGRNRISLAKMAVTP